MAKERVYKIIQGFSFDVGECKKLGKAKFTKLFKAAAEKRGANIEDWYSELTGK